jgi:hypothetical protein
MVLACVGHHSLNSQFLFKILEKHGKYLREMYDEIKALQANAYNHWRGNDWTDILWSIRSTGIKMPMFKLLGLRLRVVQVLFEFLERPYFTRVWILQELYMGSGRIVMCCGADQQPLGIVYTLSRWAWKWDMFSNRWIDAMLGISCRGRRPRVHYASGGELGYRARSLALGAGLRVSRSQLIEVLGTLRTLSAKTPEIRSTEFWHW